MPAPRLQVEVCYALAERQALVSLALPQAATVGDALDASGLESDASALAIFGRRVTRQTRLSDGDRVDILRPLAADPKELRRQRARRGRG